MHDLNKIILLKIQKASHNAEYTPFSVRSFSYSTTHFPCTGTSDRLRRTAERNQKHEPQSAVSSSDIGNYFFFPPR